MTRKSEIPNPQSEANATGGGGLCPRGLGLLAAMLFFFTLSSRAAFVYETTNEFLTSGDFNGDGRADALVLDKLTGNARVGFQDPNGALTWSTAISTGVDSATALAVGRFSATNREAIAVTSADLNRIHILNLSNPSNAPAPAIVNPPHAGTSLLVGLDAPYGVAASRSWLTAGTHDPGLTLLDLLVFTLDDLATFQDQIATDGFLSSGNSFRRFASDATLLALIQRGSNDTFVAYSYTNTAVPVLVRSNLASGTEYVFGNFNNEPFPRLLFYVPGQSNVIVQPLIQTGTGFEFGAATLNSFTSAVQKVFYVAEETNGLAVIQFGNGVAGLRPPAGGGGQLQVSYGFGVGPAGNVVTGVVPLGNGKFALLSGASNSIASLHAQVFTLAGGNYTETGSNPLPEVTPAANRGNVWLFQIEPFLSSAASLIGSLSAPAWSSTISGLPGSLSVRVESDGGSAGGLGSPGTNNFGTPPSGTVYVLPNQYRDDISFFSYSPVRAPEPSVITISPPPGSYDGSIQISFTKQNVGDDVYYRTTGEAPWQFYASTFALTNDATVQYYGQASTGARGRTQYASYILGRTNAPGSPPEKLPGSDTNTPPSGNTNFVQLSANGTVFYSRLSAVPGSNDSIWAINLDGTDETFITEGARPRVSRDGQWMAFLREGGAVTTQGNLWVRNLSTGAEFRYFTNTDSITGFDWNGNTELVFDNNCILLRQELNGPGTQLPLALTPQCLNGAPVVNPVDGRLAFHNLNPNAPGVYVTPPDWSSRMMMPEPATLRLRWPGWSFDGSRLAMADRTDSAFINTGVNLWTAAADGSNLHQITALTEPAGGFPHGAIWTPDGRALVGAGRIGGANGLWVITLAADGSACHCPPRLLPTSAGSEIDFAGSILVAPPAQIAVTPGLFIRQEPNAVVVYWSTNFAGYTLESQRTLSAGSAWTPITGPYFLAGGYYEYREPRANLAAGKFFRLHLTGVMILTPPEPELSFRLDSTEAVLSWPLSYASYSLEVTTNLSPPVIWSPRNATYQVTNGVFEYRRNLPGPPQEFYRLRWP